MAPHLIPGLTAEAASRICMEQCRAMCCQGPLVLALEAHEVQPFREQADAIGATAVVRWASDGRAWVRFDDHPGWRCPMLDPETNACRIYEHRPQRCRDFPDELTPGCAISGG